MNMPNEETDLTVWSILGAVNTGIWRRACFNNKTIFPGTGIPIIKIKPVMRPSYIYNGNSNIAKMIVST